MVIFQQYSLHHKRTVLLENFKHIANCEKSVPYASLYNFFLVDIVLVRWISLQAKRTHFVEPNLNAKHVLILWRRHDLRKKKLGTMNYYNEDKWRWNKAWEKYGVATGSGAKFGSSPNRILWWSTYISSRFASDGPSHLVFMLIAATNPASLRREVVMDHGSYAIFTIQLVLNHS